MNTIVRFLPIADPRIVISVEQIDDQQSHLWVAHGDKTSLVRWVQQMNCVMSVSALFTGTKVQEASMFLGRIRPAKFGIGLK